MYDSTPTSVVAEALRALPARYSAELRAAERDSLARMRPRAGVWSALEYTCHARDVFLVQRERLQLALQQERPEFAPMRRDERAVEERYNHQPVENVLEELTEATERFARALEELDDQQWRRTGIYPWPEPAERSVVWLARHTLHEGLHHLEDVLTGVGAVRPGHHSDSQTGR